MKTSLTILLLMAAGWSTAQTSGLSKKIRQLGTLISNTSCNCATQRDSLAKLINKGLVNLDALPAPAPVEYEQAIDNLVTVVTKLKGQPESLQQRTLSQIILDLRLKFDITADNASAENSFDLVEVEVFAQKNSVPVHNLSVYYCPLGYMSNDQQSKSSFRNLTSPVKQLMVPGYYRMWVSRPNDPKVLDAKMIEVDPKQPNKVTFNVGTN